MLIVVEGPDGAGKSTLVDKIARGVSNGRTPCARRTGEPYARLGNGLVYGDTQVLHRGPPERHPLEEYVLDLDGYDPRYGDHVVCDRWHLGEPIYGKIYRDASVLAGAGLRYVDLYLRSRGGVTLVVNADADELERRLAERGDDYVNPKDLRRISEAYDKFEVDLTIDTTVAFDHAAGLARDAIEMAERRAKQAAVVFDATDRWLGEPIPDVLLVGDVTSPRHLRGERPTYRTPFVPYPDGSGHALLGALPDPFWRTVALVNQAEVELGDVWDALGRPPVVALGGNASRACADAFGSRYAAVPHPQYVRRFFNKQLPFYGSLICDRADTRDKETPAWLSR